MTRRCFFKLCFLVLSQPVDGSRAKTTITWNAGVATLISDRDNRSHASRTGKSNFTEEQREKRTAEESLMEEQREKMTAEEPLMEEQSEKKTAEESIEHTVLIPIHQGWHHRRRRSSTKGTTGTTDTTGTRITGSIPGCIMSVIVVAWTFKNLKVITNVYFVPSILVMSKTLNLTPDVAGATLLAFGSSVPELCTNVVATFFIVNEAGLGEIVGSCIHNCLFITGLTAAFAGRDLTLWWYPLTRDSLFFLVSVVELVMIMWDGRIEAWEAGVLVGTYFVYILWMMFNQRLHCAICWVASLKDSSPDNNPVGDEHGEDGEDGEDGEEGVWWWDPAELLWAWTMPSPKASASFCFLLALVHITISTYIMIAAAEYIGKFIGIPDLFMGLVFLAAGNSIPDAFICIATARKGEADMAISNAMGSNIFDMLLGLGLPWLVSALMGKPVMVTGVKCIWYWMIIALGVSLSFFLVVVVNRWRLNVKVGVLLLVMYSGYVAWALFQSLGMAPTFDS